MLELGQSATATFVVKGLNQAKAPVINHTDAELILLESLVWRQPPFVDNEGNGGSGGY